jgi:alginate O-acetyltransferase complex protein AlgI
MLFNSLPFLFLFLPVTLAGFALLGTRNSRRLSLRWIIVCSMVFYSIWTPFNLLLVMLSITANYFLATYIKKCLSAERNDEHLASILLAVGVTANLCFLGYFKYMNFFSSSMNHVFGLDLEIVEILLPLGISFITFQKIGFLVDVRSRTIEDFSLDNFFVFVFFFPQLIAGPIVHYREMMPQFEKIKLKLDPKDIAVGLCLISMGLFKKVILADGIAVYVSPVFSQAAGGESVAFFEAWTAALAYTFQLYFDFSGYTDMALGLARLFGITLPMNFNSPLKASSIIEFWSRWHITLTRFLTAYIYTPVVMSLTRSGMRKGKAVMGRKAPSLSAFLALVAWPSILTMLLSGLWHGAGNTYIIWGGIHGILLAMNHAWRQWRPKWDTKVYERFMNPIGFIVTFTTFVATMVIFRADSVASALEVYKGMLGLNGVVIPVAVLGQFGALEQFLLSLGVTTSFGSGSYFVASSLRTMALFLIATAAPNSMEIMRKFDPALYFDFLSSSQRQLRFIIAGMPAAALRFSTSWAFIVALLFTVSVFGLNRVSEFLYWQF